MQTMTTDEALQMATQALLSDQRALMVEVHYIETGTGLRARQRARRMDSCPPPNDEIEYVDLDSSRVAPRRMSQPAAIAPVQVIPTTIMPQAAQQPPNCVPPVYGKL